MRDLPHAQIALGQQQQITMKVLVVERCSLRRLIKRSHHHAELELVVLRDLVLLGLELIHVPFGVDPSTGGPRACFFGEPDAYCAAESDVVFEHCGMGQLLKNLHKIRSQPK